MTSRHRQTVRRQPDAKRWLIAIGLTVGCLVSAGCRDDGLDSTTPKAPTPQKANANGDGESPAKTVGPTRSISFDDIKFAMEKDEPFVRSMLTESIEQLHGCPVRIRGYILPAFQQKGITRFVLVRDNMECCFGPGAALFDCIFVNMESGKSTSYTIRPVTVEGVFTIKEYRGPDGKHAAIYHLDGRSVE